MDLNPYLTYVETDNLFSLWMTNSSSAALLLSEKILDNQLLPREFFNRVKLVYPTDGDFYYEIYAACSTSSKNEATPIALSILQECLNDS